MKQISLTKWIGFTLLAAAILWMGSFFVLMVGLNYVVNLIGCF
ncbi:hypothetical protein [Paenibacillus glycanilyticus]|uniref:Uncharacterized protein n=1 Tax=Paenibacillus glycanilyticus TaxID=126569 RepID=A0ABQ6GDE3_9BACL|nr:hypothetical protein [Paenibacillus glycanilyticus]GLX68652.1 hypothetical protein MU1_29970 [Paenibacillus glycanilyticus]